MPQESRRTVLPVWLVASMLLCVTVAAGMGAYFAVFTVARNSQKFVVKNSKKNRDKQKSDTEDDKEVLQESNGKNLTKQVSDRADSASTVSDSTHIHSSKDEVPGPEQQPDQALTTEQIVFSESLSLSSIKTDIDDRSSSNNTRAVTGGGGKQQAAQIQMHGLNTDSEASIASSLTTAFGPVCMSASLPMNAWKNIAKQAAEAFKQGNLNRALELYAAAIQSLNSSNTRRR